MIEFNLDENNKLQLYNVGNILTAVIVDEDGTVKKNREISMAEIPSLFAAT